MSKPPPIFIAGANRSGTTLLRLILNAHSRVVIPDELEWFSRIYHYCRSHRLHFPKPDSSALKAAIHDYLDHGPESLKPLLGNRMALESVTRSGSVSEAFASIMGAFASIAGKPGWGEKTPSNLFFLPEIRSGFPEARLIHIVRDPRAIVDSMNRAPFFVADASINAWNLRHQWDILESAIARHFDREAVHFLKYEDLVREPERTVRGITQFLDLPFEPDMLDFYREPSPFMNPEPTATYNRLSTQSISAENASKWQTSMPAIDQSRVARICAPFLKRYGYPESPRADSPALDISRWKHTLYWHWQHVRNRHTRDWILLFTPQMAADARRRRKEQRP